MLTSDLLRNVGLSNLLNHCLTSTQCRYNGSLGDGLEEGTVEFFKGLAAKLILPIHLLPLCKLDNKESSADDLPAVSLIPFGPLQSSQCASVNSFVFHGSLLSTMAVYLPLATI